MAGGDDGVSGFGINAIRAITISSKTQPATNTNYTNESSAGGSHCSSTTIANHIGITGAAAFGNRTYHIDSTTFAVTDQGANSAQNQLRVMTAQQR